MPHESQVFRRIFQKLDDRIYVQKMNCSGANGIPDYYMEGVHGSVLWVETKIAPNTLTKLQQLWINRARKNGVNAWVVTRLKDKTFRVDVDETHHFPATQQELLQRIEECLT